MLERHHHDPSAAAPVLMPITETPGLYADAVLTDDGNNLLFLSLWGRDTAVQEFRARLSLPVHEGGLDNFHLEGLPFVQIGNPERLVTDSGRTPSQLIFGSLVHLWLYDRLAESRTVPTGARCCSTGRRKSRRLEDKRHSGTASGRWSPRPVTCRCYRRGATPCSKPFRPRAGSRPSRASALRPMHWIWVTTRLRKLSADSSGNAA